MSAAERPGCPTAAQLSRAFSERSLAMAAHAAACPQCGPAWRDWEAMAAAGRALPWRAPEPAEAQLLEARLIERALLEQQNVRRLAARRRVIGGAFAAAAAVALGFVLARGVSEEAIRELEAPLSRRGEIVAFEPGAEVDHFTRHAPSGADEVVRVRGGRLKLQVAKLTAGERFRVVTDDAEVEVRGTSFSVEVERGALLSVQVFTGAVEVRPREGAAKLLGPGERWERPERRADAEQARALEENATAELAEHAAAVEPAGELDGRAAAAPVEQRVAHAKPDPLRGPEVADDHGRARSERVEAPEARAGRSRARRGSSTVSVAGPTSERRAGAAPAHHERAGESGARGEARDAREAGASPREARELAVAAEAGKPASDRAEARAPADRPSSSSAARAAPTGDADERAPGRTNAGALTETPPIPPAAPAPRAGARAPEGPPASPAEVAFATAWRALRGGQLQRAAEAFARAEQLEPTGPLAEDAAYWRAVTLARTKATGEAIGAMTRFLTRHASASRAGEVSVMLGWLLLEQGDHASAEARFTAAAQDGSAKVRAAAREGLEAVKARRG